MACRDHDDLKSTLRRQAQCRTISRDRMRLQPFAGRHGSRRELFYPPTAKTTSPVIQPDLKKLLRKGLLDDHVNVAVIVDIPSGNCVHSSSGFEGETGIPATGEMKFYPEEGILMTKPVGIQKNGPVRLIVAVQVGYGKRSIQRRREIPPRQGAFKSILRPEAGRYESQRGGKNNLGARRSVLHPRLLCTFHMVAYQEPGFTRQEIRFGLSINRITGSPFRTQRPGLCRLVCLRFSVELFFWRYLHNCARDAVAGY